MQTFNTKILDLLGLKQPLEPFYETDSGQMLINRSIVWPALQISFRISQEKIFYSEYLMGDKDSYFIGFLIMKLFFNQIKIPLQLAGVIEKNRFKGKAQIQFNEDGKPQFYHQTFRKMNSTKDSIELTHYSEDAPSLHAPNRTDNENAINVPISQLDHLSELPIELQKIEKELLEIKNTVCKILNATKEFSS